MLYADSSLPPRRRHDHFSCWCFSPFFRRFSLSLSLPPLWLIYCPLPPLRRSCKHPPSLGFFKVLPSHAHIFYISPPRLLLLFIRSFLLVDGSGSPLGGEACVPPPPVFSTVSWRGLRFADRRGLLSAVPTPEWLRLSVISSCFWRSVRTNKMAACCFYSSDTGGGGRTATLGVKREAGGVRGKRGRLRGCSGLSVNTGSVLALALFSSLVGRFFELLSLWKRDSRASTVCSPLFPVIFRERQATPFTSNLMSI